MKKWIILFFIIVLVTVGFIYFQKEKKLGVINSYETCVAAGLPAMESYPSRCTTPDGRTFTQDIGNELEYSDEILLDNPRPNQKVTSPLQLTGKARGPWFFEAQFSTELFDSNHNSLGTAILTANGEWMTEEFAEFTGELEFTKPTTEKGILKIRNANPSGLPENQKELIIPIKF